MQLTEIHPAQLIAGELEGVDQAPATAATFADLYGRSRNDVYRAVLVAVRDPHRAEDAVQEAFARAYADWDRVKVHPNPVGWVARVALNHATSVWRRLRRESTELPPAAVAPEDERSIDPLLIRAVWSLPVRQRQVVAMRILLDQSIEQTAHALGMAPGTVRAHLHRALSTLRARLEGADHHREDIHRA